MFVNGSMELNPCISYSNEAIAWTHYKNRNRIYDILRDWKGTEEREASEKAADAQMEAYSTLTREKLLSKLKEIHTCDN